MAFYSILIKVEKVIIIIKAWTYVTPFFQLFKVLTLKLLVSQLSCHGICWEGCKVVRSCGLVN